MNMTQKVLTKIFESLLNTAAQAPTDDIVNRDGISLMKQGFELIMQAHREGGATGPTSAKELIDDFLGVGMPQKPVTLTTLSEQLARIEGKLPQPHIFGMHHVIQLDGEGSTDEELSLAVRRALHRPRGHHPIQIVLELTPGANTADLFYRDLHQLSVKWGRHLRITPPLNQLTE
ncbi:hypothetical protein LZT27_18735 [Aeromonas veronii]|uniref:hypothetical protein n=1 Tax=Aeromonas veronii TaxID=654 RepID=UPI002363E9BE|nr:hypothetical protein [Aeromonas veronii]MDD1846613.1 hypothetical protein [Aeromonas veronii]